MRIALVSPYSWTYPGGVNRHVDALARELLDRGDDVRVLAPWDPDDRRSRLLHRRRPARVERPDYLIPLGRTVGWPANQGVSNMSLSPGGIVAMHNELRRGGYDVVHVHSPVCPLLGWTAPDHDGTPVVGTFHAYSSRRVPNHAANLLGARRVFNRLRARIAVSEAAAWTGRRFFGGNYRVIPNGVDLDAPPREPKPESGELRIAFVGRAEERKGLPVLLTALRALTEHVPTRLTVIGAEPKEMEPYLVDADLARHIDAIGPLPHDERFWRSLHEADVLCAPSLPCESFGMVLIEAFAAGTPVVASGVAGYTEVVSDGVDGVLVPPADPQRLAEELQRMYLEPERRRAMGLAARESARRYAWPRIADEVVEVYEEAQRAPTPASATERAARRVGLVPVDGGPRRPPERLPSLDPPVVRGQGRRQRLARRAALGLAGTLGVGLTALAASKIGFDHVVTSVVRSNATWVLVAAGLMMLSLLFRAASWYAIAGAALPGRRIRRRDVTSATMIGVLMSATLPARLGEPARAMVLARRVGRMRQTLPVLLGTLVSQTALNVIALGLLGVIIVATTDLFHSGQKRLFVASLAPLVLLVGVMIGPLLVRKNGSGRLARVVNAVRSALVQVRSGLSVFRDPRRGPLAAGAQLSAWGIQLLACYTLSVAMGLEDRAGIGACAAVLFAVNVTAVLPATPSNIGVFQLAVISVLTAGFGVGAADALAFGVILQAVEVAASLAMGLPALVREGVTWSDMRLRAVSAAPVRLSPRPRREPADRVPSYGDALSG